jgi:hypothetical protein
MSFAAVAVVATAAVAAGTAAAKSSAAKKANGQALTAAEEAQQSANEAIISGRDSAIKRMNPYQSAGRNALDTLSQQMGLGGTYSASDVPQGKKWQTAIDADWQNILKKYNPKGKDWSSSKSLKQAYAQAQREYIALKNKTGADGQSTDPNAGALMKNFDMEAYKQDPAYTPFVNTLEELQNTPGYQFRYQQGMDATNNSAAARGSLLSGRQLKAVDQYSQSFASTEYQNAWERAQQAYQNAFSRDTTNKNNTFNRLQSMANNGQSAAGQQGEWDYGSGLAIATSNQKLGNDKIGLALAQGQNKQNEIQGYGNAANMAIGGAYNAYGGGGFGGSSGGGMVANNGLGQSTNGWANQNQMFPNQRAIS